MTGIDEKKKNKEKLDRGQKNHTDSLNEIFLTEPL